MRQEPSAPDGLAQPGVVEPPRSWLFVPGALERYVAKLAAVRPDAVVLDLEDGVAEVDLEAARKRVKALLAGNAPSIPNVVAVRTHAVPSPGFAADMRALGPRMTHLMLPKVGSAAEVNEAVHELSSAGLAHVGLVVIIESATGLEALPEILRAHGAVTGVAFGAEDFAADLGLPPAGAGALGAATDSFAEASHAAPSHAAPSLAAPSLAAASHAAARQAVIDGAKARIVMAAAAAGTPWRIDSPALGLRQTALAEESARRSRYMGFNGKLVIHPTHVAAVHRGFAPGGGEVAWAETVLGLLGGPQAGAADAGGQMVDEAIARQARAVLRAQARASQDAGESRS